MVDIIKVHSFIDNIYNNQMNVCIYTWCVNNIQYQIFNNKLRMANFKMPFAFICVCAVFQSTHIMCHNYFSLSLYNMRCDVSASHWHNDDDDEPLRCLSIILWVYNPTPI